MIRIISALILAMAATLSTAAEQPIQLADNAPDRHVVVPGDTLWGISGKFLKQPWRWPEIWRLNKDQVKNPHRIYPGDVIVLERDSNGAPFLRSQTVKLKPQIYSEKTREEIPSIPTNVINPFLSAPLVVEASALDSAPRIVTTPENRVFLGNGDTAYVMGADPKIEKWSVYRPGKAIPDPESKEILGYEAYYLGTAIQRKPGAPASFEIITAKEEIARGDRLVASPPPPLISYVPHKPNTPINGKVVSIYGGVGEAGRLSTVVISKGTDDGLEPGHVLTLHRNRLVRQRDEEGRLEMVKTPEEHYGLLFVFRTFNRLSYALVLESDGPIVVNDHIRTPE